MFGPFKKEKPYAGLGGFGGGSASLATAGVAVVANFSGAIAFWGGGGGGGQRYSNTSFGGGGGFMKATCELAPGDYTFIVGGHGDNYGGSVPAYGGGPEADGNGGGGGGYSGLFEGDLTPYTFQGEPNADPSSDRDTMFTKVIIITGGGGASGECPGPPAKGGGGGGGGGVGTPAPFPQGTGVGAAGDPAKTSGYATYPAGGMGGGAPLTAGGAAAPDGGNAGSKLMGGFPGSGGGAGGGWYGGGSGGSCWGPDQELAAGGSAIMFPTYSSDVTLTTTSGEMGYPGAHPTNHREAGGLSDPLCPGPTCGYGGASTGAGNDGAVVFGPITAGSASVTPPGGSPSPVPASGQAFTSQGKYLLTIG